MSIATILVNHEAKLLNYLPSFSKIKKKNILFQYTINLNENHTLVYIYTSN